MADYTKMTDQEIDAAARAIEQRYDELPRREARAELLAIQAERGRRSKAARIDRIMDGLSTEEREALAAKLGAPPAQTIGVGGIESSARVPGIGD